MSTRLFPIKPYADKQCAQQQCSRDSNRGSNHPNESALRIPGDEMASDIKPIEKIRLELIIILCTK